MKKPHVKDLPEYEYIMEQYDAAINEIYRDNPDPSFDDDMKVFNILRDARKRLILVSYENYKILKNLKEELSID